MLCSRETIYALTVIMPPEQLAFVAVTLAAAVVLATYALAEARSRERISRP
jgi:hypothetical protein